MTAECDAHDALLLQRNDAILNPNAPTAHHVGQHHVGREAVADNSNLMRSCNTSFRVLAEVGQDLITTAGFLHGMREDMDASSFLDSSSKRAIPVVACRAGRVGNYEQTATGISSAQGFKTALLASAVNSERQFCVRYLVRLIDRVRFRISKTVVLI